MSCCKKCNTCKTCKWWGKIERTVRSTMHGEYELRWCVANTSTPATAIGTAGDIATGPEFGCVHWEPRD